MFQITAVVIMNSTFNSVTQMSNVTTSQVSNFNTGLSGNSAPPSGHASSTIANSQQSSIQAASNSSSICRELRPTSARDSVRRNITHIVSKLFYS